MALRYEPMALRYEPMAFLSEFPLHSTHRPRRFIQLNKQCQLDIMWWREFLPSWDGVYFFDLPDWAPLPDLSLSTDATGSKGYGAFYNDEWFNGAWLPSRQPHSITYKELFPIVIV